jgi:hypothetical protein
MQQIATVSADSVVKIWDCSNMDVVASMEFPQSPEMVLLSPYFLFVLHFFFFFYTFPSLLLFLVFK